MLSTLLETVIELSSQHVIIASNGAMGESISNLTLEPTAWSVRRYGMESPTDAGRRVTFYLALPARVTTKWAIFLKYFPEKTVLPSPVFIQIMILVLYILYLICGC